MENGNTRPRRFVRVAAPLVAAAAIGAGVAVAVESSPDGNGSAAPARSTTFTQPAALTTSQLSASQIYERDVSGVVEIDVSSSTDSVPFGQGQTQGEGSGFVIDKQGYIATNAHVVQGASSITVKFHGGSQAKATLVGSDPSTDVAVVKVNVSASKLTALRLGDSSDVKPGQGVLAIGSPFGLEDTITAGIVSAVNRTIQAPDGSSINGAIQTDAAINHGNSGGPLLDLQGEVIGINSQIEGGQSGSEGNVGVGFAVPSNLVRTITSQLISSGKVEHAYLGVQVQTVADPVFGAKIQQVQPGTPAAKAGLKTGDIVATVDGKTIQSSAALQSAIAAHKPGDKVTLGVVSGGSRKTVTVTLAARPAA